MIISQVDGEAYISRGLIPTSIQYSQVIHDQAVHCFVTCLSFRDMPHQQYKILERAPVGVGDEIGHVQPPNFGERDLEEPARDELADVDDIFQG